MAKKTHVKVRLVPEAKPNSPFFYYVKKPAGGEKAKVKLKTKKYKKIKIINFGTFSLRLKKSRLGRNPKTKEKKIISERNVVLFKPSKDFKNYINNYEKI